LPCQVAQSCWGLMIEFMQGFLGSVVTSQVPPYLKSKFNDKYSPVDTIHQYLEHFNILRKGGNPNQTAPQQ
jgi:mediator of RNA polymerase II transcription subunit 20